MKKKTQVGSLTAFNARLPFAEAAAEADAAALVTAISEESRNAIKTIITSSIRDGIPPAQAARLIRNIVGLDVRRALAVQHYETSLLDIGVPVEKVHQRVEAYAKTMIARRAKAIARTEVLKAVNDGQRAAWAEAKSRGYLGDGAMKVWMSNPRDCKVCRALHGKKVPLGTDFPEAGQGPPRHPNCRCTMSLDPGSPTEVMTGADASA